MKEKKNKLVNVSLVLLNVLFTPPPQKKTQKNQKTKKITEVATEESNRRLPLFFGRVFSHDFSGFFPDVCGSVGILQLVNVHVERHGVCRR